MPVIPNEGDRVVMVRWFRIELAKQGFDSTPHTDAELMDAITAICKRASATLEEIRRRSSDPRLEDARASYNVIEIAEMFRERHDWTSGLLPRMRG